MGRVVGADGKESHIAVPLNAGGLVAGWEIFTPLSSIPLAMQKKKGERELGTECRGGIIGKGFSAVLRFV